MYLSRQDPKWGKFVNAFDRDEGIVEIEKLGDPKACQLDLGRDLGLSVVVHNLS